MSDSEKNKRVQARLGRQVTSVELRDISVQDLDQADRDPVLRFRFRLGTYTTNAGGLLLLRPRVFSEWAGDLTENGDRTQPVQFSTAILRTESVEITLPEGLSIDELPAPLQTDIGAIAYSSVSKADGGLLRYRRQIEIKDVLVSAGEIPKLKRFYQQVAADEKARVILKRR